MSAEMLRVYEPAECGKDGYPLAWSKGIDGLRIPDYVRELTGHRCIRCGHPYRKGTTPPWSICDEKCRHYGPIRVNVGGGDFLVDMDGSDEYTSREVQEGYNAPVEAQHRILTVHHLTGCWGNTAEAKRDCRWWNLLALCQRCHLIIQGKVNPAQIWPHEHSEWFKPYAAGYYAAAYLGEDLTREETAERQDELLKLELAA